MIELQESLNNADVALNDLRNFYDVVLGKTSVDFETVREYTHLLKEKKQQEILAKRAYIKSLIKEKPLKATILGVGINDMPTGTYTDREYDAWRQMIERTHSKKLQNRKPCYKGATMYKPWRIFSVFLAWYRQNALISDGRLDKDILGGSQKLYSPWTCCVVSPRINNMVIGARGANTSGKLGVFHLKNGKYIARCNNKHLGTFDTATEAYEAYIAAKKQAIQEVATNAYKNSEITKRVYDKLINWEF
jgi:hypothetical protein